MITKSTSRTDEALARLSARMEFNAAFIKLLTDYPVPTQYVQTLDTPSPHNNEMDRRLWLMMHIDAILKTSFGIIVPHDRIMLLTHWSIYLMFCPEREYLHMPHRIVSSTSDFLLNKIYVVRWMGDSLAPAVTNIITIPELPPLQQSMG